MNNVSVFAMMKILIPKREILNNSKIQISKTAAIQASF